MKASVTLKNNRDFQRLYRRGKTAPTPHVVVYVTRNRLGHNRIGITTGVKLGHAVVRNKTRRRIREVFRLHSQELKQGYDIVIVARVRAANGTYRGIERDFLKAAKKLGLLTEPKKTTEGTVQHETASAAAD